MAHLKLSSNMRKGLRTVIAFAIVVITIATRAVAQESAATLAERGLDEAKNGNAAAALADCNRALALDPKNAHAYMGRGIAKYDTGDMSGALEDLDRGIALDPAD